MISVDISNIWTCISLPDLLGMEKEVFDAHNLLQDHTHEGPKFHGWLDMPTVASGRLIYGVKTAAQKICDRSDILVVCGCGGAYQGIRAAVEACGSGDTQILFAGDSLDGRQWLELSKELEHKDYSLFLISPDSGDIASNIVSRGLRWMLERKYGEDASKRIFVSTAVGTGLHTMAQQEGYELFPMPKQLGGQWSCLTAGALVPMAAAGIDPLAVLEGAEESWNELDARSFENPVWLYAAARVLLTRKGKGKEMFCITDRKLNAFGQWWQRTCWRQENRADVQTVLLPGDLEAMEAMACTAPVFETMLQFEPAFRKVPVEMDWKDYDGLNVLSGKTIQDVEQQMLQSLVQVHNDAGVPVLELNAGKCSPENLGGAFCFFELAAALTAAVLGSMETERKSSVVWKDVLGNMG